jgi:signal transduction histidine kinase
MSHVTASDSSRLTDSENYQPDHSFNLKVEERSAVASSALVAQRLSALGEMTGGIVHDFRNILAVIDSSLRLLAKSSNDPEGLHAFIAGARDGLDRGLRLTSQLLSFAKQRELEPQSANASELLKSLELFLKYGAGSAIRIVFELASDIPRCLIDPSQFNAAILNLVINARDAMPNGGEIRISTTHCIVHEVASDLTAPGCLRSRRVADNGKRHVG